MRENLTDKCNSGFPNVENLEKISRKTFKIDINIWGNFRKNY